MIAKLLANNANNEILTASWKKQEEDQRAAFLESRIAGMSDPEKDLIRDGSEIFSQLCPTCHGEDGKGKASLVAPPLAGQRRVNGDPNELVKILLNGLSGPVDGKDYPDAMPAMGSNNNKWIASVLSYIRNDMGNKASVVDSNTVKKIRRETATRKAAWTLKELEK
jgi:mono/diheme cytochrome c family protein